MRTAMACATAANALARDGLCHERGLRQARERVDALEGRDRADSRSASATSRAAPRPPRALRSAPRRTRARQRRAPTSGAPRRRDVQEIGDEVGARERSDRHRDDRAPLRACAGRARDRASSSRPSARGTSSASEAIAPQPVEIRVDLEEDLLPVATPFGRLVDDLQARSLAHAVEQAPDVVLVEAQTAVRGLAPDRPAHVGAVDAVRGAADRDPAAAERIVGTRGHLGGQLGLLGADRRGDVPGRILALGSDLELAEDRRVGLVADREREHLRAVSAPCNRTGASRGCSRRGPPRPHPGGCIASAGARRCPGRESRDRRRDSGARPPGSRAGADRRRRAASRPARPPRSPRARAPGAARAARAPASRCGDCDHQIRVRRSGA